MFLCRVEFPPCVQWFTIEFDQNSGTAQAEDYLLISIPKNLSVMSPSNSSSLDQSHSQYIDDHDSFDGINPFDSENLGVCKNARLTTSFDIYSKDRKSVADDDEWHIAQMFNK